MEPDVEVLADQSAIAARAADLFVDTVASAIKQRGSAHVVVTGGGTGIAVLSAIGAHHARLDWSRIHVWWGDERFVPQADPQRNDRQADEALLSAVQIPRDQVHRIAASDGPFGDDVDAAAAAYAVELAAFDQSDEPLFDVLMLGVGEEGHTASIFPDSPATLETAAACAVRDCPKPPPTRVSLTPPTLARAREVWLMTAGAGKAPAVAAALSGASARDIPAAGPRGTDRTLWLIDRAAAADIL